MSARSDRRQRSSYASTWGPGFFVKLILMALIDALGVYGLLATWNHQAMGLFWPLLALLLAANYIYFARHTLPMKYIFPGLAFLLVFQLFVIGYTFYVSFTNFGGANNVSKDQAIAQLLVNSEQPVQGAANYPVAIVEHDGDLGFAIEVSDSSTCQGASAGDICAGTSADPLAVVTGATADSNGQVTSMPAGWTILTQQDILGQQSEITNLRVAVSDDPNDGSLSTRDARTAVASTPTLTYDAATDTMTDTSTGKTYTPNNNGQFQSADGSTLNIGWRVGVGLRNYTTAFGNSQFSGPFVRVLLWTVAFAFLSVATTFLLGLFLAIVFNDMRLKGRSVYRTLLIFPYAIPGFLAALIWSGMLNLDFGFINQTLLGGAHISWLTDPWLARASVIGVNLWLGFPYMFLICTGALQSLPDDIMEAARVDGASPWQQFSKIKMPLLLISTAPLLISSFAFNFNNFTLIWMLTRGGPAFPNATVPIGATDILISMVYQVSGLSGGTPNYGLASALSIIVFLIVGTVSTIAFRQTRKLEEVM